DLIDDVQTMPVRGIRGATSVEVDCAAEILKATRELLEEVLRANCLDTFEEIASIHFTTTPDLVATFPAEAAREMGMQHVPLICSSEIAVPNRLPRCIRVLLHVNSEKPQREIVHVYLREARKLRPDIGAQ
ncbi:MAG TPA: chorismate mutase, partial [Planctomycetaceae bacterium]|nr:chorismate mutase [Planctomycetaceae bacterium]